MRTLKIYKQNGPIEPSALLADMAAAMPEGLSILSLGTASKRGEEDPAAGYASVDVGYSPADPEDLEGRDLTEQEAAVLQAALDAHDGAAVLDRQAKLAQALQWSREQLVNTVWGNMSSGERKLVLGLALTAGEEDEIVAEWEAR